MRAISLLCVLGKESQLLSLYLLEDVCPCLNSLPALDILSDDPALFSVDAFDLELCFEFIDPLIGLCAELVVEFA
jgi:hypothetical protein